MNSIPLYKLCRDTGYSYSLDILSKFDGLVTDNIQTISYMHSMETKSHLYHIYLGINVKTKILQLIIERDNEDYFRKVFPLNCDVKDFIVDFYGHKHGHKNINTFKREKYLLPNEKAILEIINEWEENS